MYNSNEIICTVSQKAASMQCTLVHSFSKCWPIFENIYQQNHSYFCNEMKHPISPKRVECLRQKTSESQKHFAINDKSQGSVATSLMCDDLFNNHFTTNLLPSLTVKELF